MTSFGLSIAGFCALAWAMLAAPAAAQDQVFFTGKTITMTVGFGGGGSVDLYGRLLGRYLTRHLPGTPSLVVVNQVGAGGVVALNGWVTRAQPNGLFVTIAAESQIDPDALLRTEAKYDPTKLRYVGGLAAYSQGLFIKKEAVQRLTDKSAKPAIMGIVGATLRSGNYGVLWGVKFLGWHLRWVRGYPSTSELRQALERGEIDMSTFGASRDIKSLFDTGDFAVVSQGGFLKDGNLVPRALFGNAPILADLVKGKIKDPEAQLAFDYTEDVSQIGIWLALPPGTPDDIVATYVKAFHETLEDPGYVADFAKIDPDSPVASEADIERLVRETSKVSPDTLKYIQAEMKRQDFDRAN